MRRKMSLVVVLSLNGKTRFSIINVLHTFRFPYFRLRKPNTYLVVIKSEIWHSYINCCCCCCLRDRTIFKSKQKQNIFISVVNLVQRIHSSYVTFCSGGIMLGLLFHPNGLRGPLLICKLCTYTVKF
jgi:hypothetical protein